MIKDFLKELKLSRLSYLLETIEVRDFRSKIKAFNKIRKMKLDEDSVKLILKSIKPEEIDLNGEVNISLSLLALILNDINFKGEYSQEIDDIFKKLTNNESKYEILNMLSLCQNEDAIILYRELLLKYCTNIDSIPIGILSNNGNNYGLLFPELYKALKFKSKRNNVLLLITDFINYNVVPEEHIKKNKKVIQDSIIEILKDAVNYKHNKDQNIMQNKDYIDLRILLEAAINIEYYVTNTQTKSYLEKLLKKKDNQLKLFILENYIKKGKDISKINLNLIAKDELSRYPLYSFLMFYNLERLMPKKYSNNLSLSESDLFINYCINYNYNNIPFDFELLDSKIINNRKYFIYKFKTYFNYTDEVKDPATDYILKNTALDKTLKENTIVEYIGISGGFNKELDPSAIERNLKSLLIHKLDGDQDKIIENLLNSIEKEKKVENKVEQEKTAKKEEKKETKVKEEKTETKPSRIKGLFTSISDKLKVISLSKKKNKVVKEKVKKEKLIKSKKNIDFSEDIYDDEILYEKEVEKEPTILRRIFSFNTLLLLLSFALCSGIFVLITYVIGFDLLNLKEDTFTDNSRLVKKVELKSTNYKDISFNDIFTREESQYYVLFFEKKNKTEYYAYLNEILENGYKFYFVDTSREENKAIFSGNPTGFVINTDTLLKVNEREYEFYVVKKENIIHEFKDYVDSIDDKKEEDFIENVKPKAKPAYSDEINEDNKETKEENS